METEHFKFRKQMCWKFKEHMLNRNETMAGVHEEQRGNVWMFLIGSTLWKTLNSKQMNLDFLLSGKLLKVALWRNGM